MFVPVAVTPVVSKQLCKNPTSRYHLSSGCGFKPCGFSWCGRTLISMQELLKLSGSALCNRCLLHWDNFIHVKWQMRSLLV